MAGSGEHPAFRRTPSGRCRPTGSSQLRDDWLPQHHRADDESPRDRLQLLRSSYAPCSAILWAYLQSNFSVPFILPVQRRSGPAFAGVPRFPRSREWGAAVTRYRTVFTALEIRPQDVLFRLPNLRLYILDSTSRRSWRASILIGRNTRRGGPSRSKMLCVQMPRCLRFRKRGRRHR